MDYPKEVVKKDILEMLGLTTLYKNKGLSDERKAEAVKKFKSINEKFAKLNCVDDEVFKRIQIEGMVSIVAEKIETIRSEIYATAVLYIAKSGNMAMTDVITSGTVPNSSVKRLLRANDATMRYTYKLVLATAEDLANEIAEFLYTDYIDIANKVFDTDMVNETLEVKTEKTEKEDPFITLLKHFEQLKEGQRETPKPLPAKKIKTSFADYAKDFI